VHVDRGRLPDAVGAIFSLLDVSGVPVELGKHHMAGSGEGQTLERRQTRTSTAKSKQKNPTYKPPQNHKMSQHSMKN